ncbi:MAG: TPM domain-containing protein, partial [Lachnospiraceae bacterium]|nr:TPM domain-containing protein [Lachnospiraceae bacterium]
MNKLLRLLLLALASVFFLVSIPSIAARAEDFRYVSIVEDDADLLSDDEIRALKNEMDPIRSYCNVAFHTCYSEGYSSEIDYAEDYLQSRFGRGSESIVLVIDMKLRKITIYSDGSIYDKITSGKADSITDNVYTYATDGHYYECASEAFREILTILEGGRIAEPMKVISNALLSIAISFLVMFLIVASATKLHRPSASELAAASSVNFAASAPNVVHTGQTRRYDPPSSSSGGGGGG